MIISEGQIVEGKVTGIKPYGAFIELKDGPVGLAYIEDISVSVSGNTLEEFINTSPPTPLPSVTLSLTGASAMPCSNIHNKESLKLSSLISYPYYLG